MLPLTANPPQRIVAELHLQFILVHALRGPSENQITLPCALQSLTEFAVEQLRAISQLRHFLNLGYRLVQVGKKRHERLNKRFALSKDIRCMRHHLHLYHLKQLIGN